VSSRPGIDSQLGREVYEGSWVDTCVPYRWSKQDEVVDYMTAAWAEYLGKSGTLPDGGGSISILPRFPYGRPGGDKAEVEDGKNPEPRELAVKVLGDGPANAGVLVHEDARLIPALPNASLADEVARAVNDWTVDRWLSEQDSRLYGLVLAANQLPEAAAQEIRRIGTHPRMVGVLMGGNGLGKPFGHPLYHPIYEAAAELDLTIVVIAGGDARPDTLSQTSAGGLPSTFAEYRVLSAQPVMTHVVSMIGQGIFEKYANLRVFVLGVGVSWIPSVFWRFDNEFKALRRDAPWLTRDPSEYFRRYMAVSTYPLHPIPKPDALQRLLTAFGGLESNLCFASCYSEWDGNSKSDIQDALPHEWWPAIFRENALRIFPRIGSTRSDASYANRASRPQQ
jgi:uncharacterized protein